MSRPRATRWERTGPPGVRGPACLTALWGGSSTESSRWKEMRKGTFYRHHNMWKIRDLMLLLERHCFYIMSSCPSSIMSLFKKILGNWDLLFVGEGVSQNQGPDSLVRIYNSKEEWRLCQMRESFPLQRQWKTKNQNISWHQTESPNLSWSLPVCLFMPVILVKITVVE